MNGGRFLTPPSKKGMLSSRLDAPRAPPPLYLIVMSGQVTGAFLPHFLVCRMQKARRLPCEDEMGP